MDDALAVVAREALAQSGSAFSRDLSCGFERPPHLAAAAGLDGQSMASLAEAVRAPNHPIARTAGSARAEFNVTPMAAGGPALRSHAPLLDADSAGAIGVLALAHQDPLTTEQRQAILDLTHRASTVAVEYGARNRGLTFK